MAALDSGLPDKVLEEENITVDRNKLPHATKAQAQKKALGDVKNTIHVAQQRKGNVDELPSSTSKKTSSECQFTIHSDGPMEDCNVCGECQNLEKDTYEDIRPLSTRLDIEDIEKLIDVVWRPLPLTLPSVPPVPQFDIESCGLWLEPDTDWEAKLESLDEDIDAIHVP